LNPDATTARVPQAPRASKGTRLTVVIRKLVASNLARWLAMAVFFSVAAIIQTWPLVLHLSDRLSAWEGAGVDDTWVFTWNLWWVKHSLIDLQTNPFHTDLLFYPEGSDLYLHTLAFANGLLALPLQVLTGNTLLSWNLLALVYLVLSGLSMYALARRVVGNRSASLIAGYLFAFAPYTLMRLGGHWHLFTTWPIPLFYFLVLKSRDTGQLKYALGAGASWAFLAYNSLEYAAWAGLLLAILILCWSIERVRAGDRASLLALWRGLAVTAVAWLVITSPLLTGTLIDIASGDYDLPRGDEFYSGDLLGFVTPSPLWGPGTGPEAATPTHASIGGNETTIYLGILPSLLAGTSLILARHNPQRVLPWAVAFLVFVVLSLGPYLYIDGTKSLSLFGASFSIPLPYQLYDRIPLLGVERAPARFIIFAFVALSVLAALGIDYLLSSVKQAIQHWAAVPLTAAVILGIIALEYWNPPVYLYDPPQPEILKAIGDEPGEFAVLDVPWGRGNGGNWAGDNEGSWLATYYQTLHGKPTPGGFLSRSKHSAIDWVSQQPGLRFLACVPCTQSSNTPEDMDPDLVRQLLERYRIKYLLVRPGNAGFQAYQDYLGVFLGFPTVYNGPDFIVYRNPDVE